MRFILILLGIQQLSLIIGQQFKIDSLIQNSKLFVVDNPAIQDYSVHGWIHLDSQADYTNPQTVLFIATNTYFMNDFHILDLEVQKSSIYTEELILSLKTQYYEENIGLIQYSINIKRNQYVFFYFSICHQQKSVSMHFKDNNKIYNKISQNVSYSFTNNIYFFQFGKSQDDRLFEGQLKFIIVNYEKNDIQRYDFSNLYINDVKELGINCPMIFDQPFYKGDFSYYCSGIFNTTEVKNIRSVYLPQNQKLLLCENDEYPYLRFNFLQNITDFSIQNYYLHYISHNIDVSDKEEFIQCSL